MLGHPSAGYLFLLHCFYPRKIFYVLTPLNQLEGSLIYAVKMMIHLKKENTTMNVQQEVGMVSLWLMKAIG
jgi:hypothetical protein